MGENHSFWGFHIYARGDSIVQKGYVALGWPEMGDLSKLPLAREAFKAKVAEVYANASHVPQSAGQLFRFLHEMREGDVIIFRSKVDRQVHIGKVAGPYEYRPDLHDEYCSVRPVQWLKTVPATQFSQGALHELGSALTLFQVRNYAQEYEAVLAGEAPPQVIAEDDDTVGMVAEEIEQTTRDFVLKQLAHHLKGYPFQGFVANLLETMGYRTHVLPKGADEGIDIIAHKDELKLEPPIIKVQVKSGEGSVGGPDVRALFGNLGANEVGLLVCLGTLSAQATDFAKRKSNLRLINGDELVDFVLEHYEALDPRYKALLPLKKVYVPEPITEEPEKWADNKTVRTATASA